MPGPVFHDPVECHVGRQSRTLMLTPDAWARAEKALGRSPRFALSDGDLHVVSVVGACALHHESRKISPATIIAWVTEEPKCTPRLVEAVGEAVRRYLVATGVFDEETLGGAPAPTSNPSTNTAP